MFKYTTTRKNNFGRKLFLNDEGNLVGAECTKCKKTKEG